MAPSRINIGIISDTHGLLRHEAIVALSGVDQIIHAGDIGKPEILDKLAEIAPVTAVRGNNDHGAWAAELPESRYIRIGNLTIFLIHDLKEISFDLREANVDIVIAGHSHRPLIETRDDVMFINPGSAGPRRFKLPISVALLEIGDGIPAARIIQVDAA
ncbi:metallophosphoesterase family protein [Oxalobacteraceae bacterium R-40]|uniref:Phosphoesterase n=1 Tax=Keguizhuia sedimenti TaxID=3064264 RepID=A0ABU1BMH6_9BURK|nr:metallophosphoesterase family protein [Oxalobacteraceae bacterium R-40]